MAAFLWFVTWCVSIGFFGAREMGSGSLRLTPPLHPRYPHIPGMLRESGVLFIAGGAWVAFAFYGFYANYQLEFIILHEDVVGWNLCVFYSIQPYGKTTGGAEDVARLVAGIRGFVLV